MSVQRQHEDSSIFLDSCSNSTATPTAFVLACLERQEKKKKSYLTRRLLVVLEVEGVAVDDDATRNVAGANKTLRSLLYRTGLRFSWLRSVSRGVRFLVFRTCNNYCVVYNSKLTVNHHDRHLAECLNCTEFSQ